MASIALGDIAKAAGQTADASEWYEKAQLDPAGHGNAFQSLAAARLLLVNAKPPTKVKPSLPPVQEAQTLSPLNLEVPDTGVQPAAEQPATAPVTPPITPTPAAPNPTPETPAP